MWTDRQTDVGHINLIGGLVTCNPPKNPQNLDTNFFYYVPRWRFAISECSCCQTNMLNCAFYRLSFSLCGWIFNANALRAMVYTFYCP